MDHPVNDVGTDFVCVDSLFVIVHGPSTGTHRRRLLGEPECDLKVLERHPSLRPLLSSWREQDDSLVK